MTPNIGGSKSSDMVGRGSKIVRRHIWTFLWFWSPFSFSKKIPEKEQERGLGLVPTTLIHSGCLDSKKIFPLLTRPQGSQGCQKITSFFLQMKLFSFCAKIASKRHKVEKPSKLTKKCQKNPVFLDIFEYSSIWGQS